MAISTSVVSPHMPTGFVSAVAAGGRYVIGIGTNPGGTVGVFTVYDSVDDSMNAYEWSPASGVSLGVGDVARPLFGGVATLMPGGLVVCFPDGTYDAYALSWPIGPKSGSLFSWDTNGSTLTVFFYTGSGLSAAYQMISWNSSLSVITSGSGYYSGPNRGPVTYGLGYYWYPYDGYIRKVNETTFATVSTMSITGSVGKGTPALGSMWLPSNRKIDPATDAITTTASAFGPNMAMGDDGRFYWASGSTLSSWKEGLPLRSDALPFSASRWDVHSGFSGSFPLRLAYR